MAYQLPPKRARVARKAALDGAFEDLFDQVRDAWNTSARKTGGAMWGDGMTADQRCMAEGNKITSELDARRTDLVKNWNPSGFYSVQQVSNVVGSGLAMLKAAADQVRRVESEGGFPQGARDTLKMLITNIQVQMNESVALSQAVGVAQKSGITVMDVPGLKRWVTRSMLEASGSLAGASYLACMKPWWVGALQGFMTVFNVFWAMTKGIVGVVVAAGQAVLHVPDAISTAIKLAKWGVVAGLGYWFYTGGHKQLAARFKK